jgi:hypothetical protein
MKVHPRLDVSTLPAFVNRYAREAGLPAMPKGRDDTESMQEQLAIVCIANPDMRYDALIVDEGQDFGATLLGSLQNLLRDPDGGTFYCFYDDNQKVQLGGAAIAQLLPKSPMSLNRILRNTKNIVDSYRGLLPRLVHSVGPSGPDTRFLALADPAAALRAVLQQLTEDAISPSHIAVLAPDSAWLDREGGAIVPLQGEFANAEDLPDDRVVLDTVRRFKGLEQQAVVVVAPSSYAHEPEMLYVAMSRARALLVLVDTVTGIALVKSKLTESQHA